MDVQGAEAEIIAASTDVLNEKVRRLHVGTHSSEIDITVYDTLRQAGWHCSHAFGCRANVVTHYGECYFQDGVQSWLNPRLF
jgi:hypothetical protein